MKTKENNKILLAVCDNYGKYTKGTIIMVDNVLYILDDGNCYKCDLRRHCNHKPFNCSADVTEEDDFCLKKMEGGL